MIDRHGLSSHAWEAALLTWPLLPWWCRLISQQVENTLNMYMSNIYKFDQ